MKTKIPILLAVMVFVVSFSQAQYYTGYHDSRVVVQGSVVIPGSAVIAYNYNTPGRERYEDQRGWAGYDNRHDRRQEVYRDWRAEKYEQYCRDQRNYRMSREVFYPDHCNDRDYPKQKHGY